MLKKCIEELEKRFTINYPAFTVKIADADGIRVIPKSEWSV